MILLNATLIQIQYNFDTNLMLLDATLILLDATLILLDATLILLDATKQYNNKAIPLFLIPSSFINDSLTIF